LEFWFMETAKMSSKGQVVVPKALRARLGFDTGAELEIIEGDKQVTFKLIEAPRRRRTLSLKEFLALQVNYTGPSITDEMLREGINAEAVRRWHAKGN
jgi:AbrB family looped-hinge helix DNA binding protein